MTEDLSARLSGLQRAIAAPLPSPEELAAGKAADRAMAERIVKARPGIPLHHAYAVLETLRTIQRVEAAKAAPAVVEDDCCGAPPPDDWTGDCWCTLPPDHDGQHHCQPCTDRHGAPGWDDDEEEACEDCGWVGSAEAFHTCNDDEETT